MRALLIAGVLLAWGVGCQRAAGNVVPTKVSRQPAANECLVMVEVEKMVCDVECPPSVFGALEGLDGVLEVAVDYSRKRADVLATAPMCQNPDGAGIADALVGVGFDGRVLKVRHGR